MSRHWMAGCLVSGALMACADSTAPPSRSGDPPILSLPEYAAQLRGDPFLKSVSGMIGRPQVADVIDASLNSITNVGQSGPNASRFPVASARLDLAVSSADTVAAVTEADLLAAVLMVTLDRIAQVSGDSAAEATAENRPPSR